MLSPLAILRARAEARAVLFSVAEFPDLATALEPLERFAEEQGLVDQFGRETIDSIIIDPFKQYLTAM